MDFVKIPSFWDHTLNSHKPFYLSDGPFSEHSLLYPVRSLLHSSWSPWAHPTNLVHVVLYQSWPVVEPDWRHSVPLYFFWMDKRALFEELKRSRESWADGPGSGSVLDSHVFRIIKNGTQRIWEGRVCLRGSKRVSLPSYVEKVHFSLLQRTTARSSMTVPFSIRTCFVRVLLFLSQFFPRLFPFCFGCSEHLELISSFLGGL